MNITTPYSDLNPRFFHEPSPKTFKSKINLSCSSLNFFFFFDSSLAEAFKNRFCTGMDMRDDVITRALIHSFANVHEVAE